MALWLPRFESLPLSGKIFFSKSRNSLIFSFGIWGLGFGICLEFVICNFPDKPGPFGFRLVRVVDRPIFLFKLGAVLLEYCQVLRAEAAPRVQVFKAAALDEKTGDIDQFFAFEFDSIKINF